MHQCPVCPKSFPSPYKLQRHHFIHTGQKPFNCEICGKAFTQAVHLKSHLEKVHHSRHPKDSLRDGSNQQANCDKPAAGIHGRSDYTIMPSIVSSSVASQWKKETVTDTFVLPSFEIGNPPETVSHADDGSVAHRSVSNALSPVTQEQVHSTNEDTFVSSAHNEYTCQVCLKSFSSSLQLWIHAPIHDKPQQSKRGRETTKKSKITVRHECPKCLKTFCTPSKLKRHFLIHTGQKPYSCNICWRAFRQKVHLKSHLSTPGKCSLSARKNQRLCQNSDLPLRSSLQQQPIHRTPVKSSAELELQCKISVNAAQDPRKTEIKTDADIKSEQPLNPSICHKTEEEEEQEQQYMSHRSLKPFQCGICSRSFRFEVNLIRHHKTHKSPRELGSDTPVQTSNDVTVANSETLQHLPESSSALNIIVKPETWSDVCSDYNGGLPRDADLTTSAEQQWESCHATSKQQRIRTLHQCHACLKCFPSVSKLQRHMMTHTGQRPFGCELCGKKFRQKTHLRVHCRTHVLAKYHKQRSQYIKRPPSSIGGFNTRMAADIPVQGMLAQRKDFRRCFGDEVSVKHLDQTTPMIWEPTNREPETKPHTSKRNGFVHKRRTQIAKSMQNPGSAQHKCLQCLKCFPSASKLRRHEMVHTGLKPFHCLLCGKAFRQAPHLKTHERSHCQRKPSKPLNQRGNIRKLKVKSQQQPYPRITVSIPSQKKSVNRDAMLSNSEVVGNRANALPDTRRDVSITEVNSLSKTKSKSNLLCKKRKLHMCRICCKNFASPYKLARHLVTHSGMRPYKCTLCGKTFTQKGHLKIHEHRCRQGNGVSDSFQSEMINTNHLQDTCTENLADYTDFSVTATREQQETQYTSFGHSSFAGKDVAHCSEAVDTEWLAVSEAGLKEENSESEEKQPEIYHHATDDDSSSFSSDLVFEINKLVQNENMAHQHEGDARNLTMSCPEYQDNGTVSDSNSLLSDEFVSSVVDNQMQPNTYWCEPLTVFECDKCTARFKSEVDLRQHICSANVQLKLPEPPQRNRCDICCKNFVSPSKLKRHYLIHTGQRPFRCDICGKGFTQATHVRTHQLTH